MHTGKTLLNLVDREEKLRIESERDFKIPDYRSGDVVKFTMKTSVSENKTQDYSGIVFSKKSPNSIRAGCKINFNVETVNTTFGVNLYSPMVTNFHVLKYGSNHLRKKMMHIPSLDLSAGRLQEPLIKGRNFKVRSSSKKVAQATKKKEGLKGKIKREGYKLDKYDD